MKIWLLGSTALLATVISCTSLDYGDVDLGVFYNRAAQHHAPDRRPIIVIPGILGSELVDRETGRTVWGAFSGGYARPNQADGARLVALPLVPGQLDAVEATAVLERLKIRLLGLPLSLRAYINIIQVLGAGGYADENLGLSGSVDYGDDHFTCFQFAYDFRLGNAENAKRLHRFMLEKRALVQKEYAQRFGIADAEIKFDIVAHSMGGLLTRYYLRYGDAELGNDGPLPEITWAGSELVERAILVGTPNAGSIEALINLVDGEKLGPLLPRYPAELLGTFPSVYELMPRARHGAVVWQDDGQPIGDLFDPRLWHRLGWGLASPAQDKIVSWLAPDEPDLTVRRRLADDYLSWALNRARRFTEAIDRPATPPAGTELFLVAGDSVPTPRTAAVDRATGAIHTRDSAAGDGRVLRSSALLDERERRPDWAPQLDSPIDWSKTLFLPDNHLGLTSNPVFSNNVLYWLLEEPR